MRELSRYLFLAGAAPFLLLGAVHAWATPRRPDDRKGLSPEDPNLPAAMGASAILLTRRTNMWLAWVGFNLSHSLGALLFGIVVLLTGRSAEAFARDGAVFLPFALVVAVSYVFLAVRFWFRAPIIGLAVSLFLFAASTVLFFLGSS